MCAFPASGEDPIVLVTHSIPSMGYYLRDNSTMDPRVRFENKAESEARRITAFLALTPAERFMWFLRSFRAQGTGPRPEHAGNFIIRKRRDPVR